MLGLFLLSHALMRRIEPFFSEPHSLLRIDDYRAPVAAGPSGVSLPEPQRDDRTAHWPLGLIKDVL